MNYFLKDCNYYLVINHDNKKIIECNNDYADLIGISKEEICKQTLLERVNIENSIMFIDVLKDVANGTKALVSLDHYLKDNNTIKLDCYLSAKGDKFISIWMKENSPVFIPIKRRRLLDMILDYAPDMFWAKDLQGKYLFANKTMCQKILGVDDIREVVGKSDRYFSLKELSMHYTESESSYALSQIREANDELVIKNLEPMHFEESGKIKGKHIYIDVHKAPLYDENEVLIGTVGVGRDITKQKELENQLEKDKSEKIRLFESLLNSTIEGLLLFDINKRCVHFNSQIKDIFGYSESELWQKKVEEFASKSYIDTLIDIIKSSDSKSYEVILKKSNDTDFWALVKSKVIELDGNKMFILAVVDISILKEKERAITFQAEHDPLTNLINRRHFFKIFETILKKTDQSRQYRALLFIDLDKFKPINDTMGHNIGDKILQLVAQRLQSSLRKSDLISRFGGDEFLALITTETTDLKDAKKLIAMIAEKILRNIKAPYGIENRSVEIGASIGITIFNSSERDPNQLILDADSAMYRAKSEGGNCYTFHEE